MSATNAQVIAALKTIVDTHVVLALTSYVEPGTIEGQASIGVVDGDSLRHAGDRERAGILVDVSILVPINEAAADWKAEKEARQASAESLFDAVKSEIEDTYTPWRAAWMESRPRFNLVRPQPHVLCAGASATFGIAL